MNRPTRTMCISRTGGERFLPTLPAGATLLGTVQRGQQIGALVELADHTYAQVNGDVMESLNTSQVEHALRSLVPARRAAWPNKTSIPRHLQSGPSAEPAPSKAPVVIIKRRRMVVQPR